MTRGVLGKVLAKVWLFVKTRFRQLISIYLLFLAWKKKHLQRSRLTKQYWGDKDGHFHVNPIVSQIIAAIWLVSSTLLVLAYMLEFEPFFQSSASEPILTSWTTCCWKRWANEVILGMSLRIWKSTNMLSKATTWSL